MKRSLLLLSLLTLISFMAEAQFKKDGTPDMRFSANKAIYGNAPSLPVYSMPITTGVQYQSGYFRSSGTYVEPYLKTTSNGTNRDNFSTSGNYNIYSGVPGSRARDYSVEAYNYGNGSIIQTGPRGGQYYTNSNGNKIYVPKRY